MASALLAVATVVGLAQGPAAGIPELKALDQWSGSWDSRSDIGGAERTGESKGEWVLGGRYLRQSWTIEPSEGMPEVRGESLMTYDPRARVYRTWGFDSEGGATSGEGRWDAGSRTMTWTGRDVGGEASITTTARFPEDGREEWTILVKDKAGATLVEMKGTNRRRP
jgi:hypothetical protein